MKAAARVLFFSLWLQPHFSMAQSFPAIQFQAGFGGTDSEVFRAIAPASDGGALLGGFSHSPISGNKTAAAYGSDDFWVVKIDSHGVKQWDRSFGDPEGNELSAIVPVADSGYLLGGTTYTTGSNCCFFADFWIVKFDAVGNKQWDQRYGGRAATPPMVGNGYDYLTAIVPAADGGFLLVGSSGSPADTNKTAALHGSQDMWIVRIDALGNKLWDQSYGGTNWSSGACAVATSDGGFLIGGVSFRGGGGTQTSPGFGETDFWIVKVDSDGTQQWDRSFGGASSEELRRILPTSDGGFLLAGWTALGPSGNKTSESFGGWDFWIVKISALGDKQWEVAHGGNGSDYLNDIVATIDGGYLVGGSSTSLPSGTKTAPFYPNPSDPSGSADYWLLKIDASGRREWDQSYGGNSSDNLGAILPMGGGDILLGGYSRSATNSNKTVLSYGDSDWWVLRIAGTNPPAITNQPQGGTFTAGETVNLSIGVESFTRAIFQWRRNGEDLPGQTNSILSLVAIDSGDAGNYTCIVSNSFGSAESMIATLTYSEAASLQLTLNPVLTLFGAPGRTYRVEWTLNPSVASSWASMTNITLTNSPQQWTDPRPTTQTNRFYRAILVPQ